MALARIVDRGVGGIGWISMEGRRGVALPKKKKTEPLPEQTMLASGDGAGQDRRQRCGRDWVDFHGRSPGRGAALKKKKKLSHFQSRRCWRAAMALARIVDRGVGGIGWISMEGRRGVALPKKKKKKKKKKLSHSRRRRRWRAASRRWGWISRVEVWALNG